MSSIASLTVNNSILTDAIASAKRLGKQSIMSIRYLPNGDQTLIFQTKKGEVQRDPVDLACMYLGTKTTAEHILWSINMAYSTILEKFWE